MSDADALARIYSAADQVVADHGRGERGGLSPAAAREATAAGFLARFGAGSVEALTAAYYRDEWGPDLGPW